MITYYKNNKGLVQTEKREENCWINVVCPTKEETKFLLKELQIPEDFYSDIEDIDERPRIEIENDWTLIIWSTVIWHFITWPSWALRPARQDITK